MAGLVSPATLEQIRAASDIVDIIGAVLPLKRAGANFRTLCPFHREKSPSFNVNPHRQIFYCFGCHKGGDVFAFIREYENLSFMEAVRRLAERARIPLELEKGSEAGPPLISRTSCCRSMSNSPCAGNRCSTTMLAARSRAIIWPNAECLAEAIQLFRLGYAPDQWDDTVNWAASKGFDVATMEQAGLVIRKEETNRYYDRFRGRLMFPICDEQGRIIAFSGRVLGSRRPGSEICEFA